AAERINLTGSSFSHNLPCQIYDMTGRVQLDGQITQGRGEIDVKELRNGVYILRIVEQGEVYCSKFEVHQ
ncbi:MAG: T9SS type A sorting domain-containing protein, partial [Bacteroidota bacterium]